MSRRLVMGPFNRVEGDLEVTLEVADGRVQSARVNSPLYRGFEQILLGKAPEDALVFVPRICGICSVAQSAAAAAALSDAMGIAAPPNGRLAGNLTLAAENLADHLTHFYLFFMPDFARAAYASRPWFEETATRFKAVSGSAANEVLAARSQFMEVMGLLAGKWPHTLALQAGGSSRPLQGSEKIRLHRLLRGFRGFLERTLFGDSLEAVAALSDADALAAWAAGRGGRGDFARFVHIADDLHLHTLGRATDLFLSYGTYASVQTPGFARGVFDARRGGEVAPLDANDIREDLHSSWYAEAEAPQHPSTGSTVPMADKDGAYSWAKAPRLAGRVAETGALARQVVDGHPLIRSLVVSGGGNVKSRVVARLLELARVLPEMERWVEALHPGEPYCVYGELPEEANAVGLVEAARGGLGHWLNIRRGRIHGYQIIAPTTWNFSPRDSADQPGALEQALVGAEVGEGDDGPPSVQHIVRSFDPCMVCTVH